MIVIKEWQTREKGRLVFQYTGWFLFGILPIYIRRHGIR